MSRASGPILPELRSIYAPQPISDQRPARGIGVPTLCGAVSIRENSIFVPGVPDL